MFEQLDACLGLALRDHLVLLLRLVQAAFQGLVGSRVQVIEQGGLPGVPAPGIGAAHIGDGQQVEIVEARGGAHELGKFLDDVGVIDVLVLGDV